MKNTGLNRRKLMRDESQKRREHQNVESSEAHESKLNQRPLLITQAALWSFLTAEELQLPKAKKLYRVTLLFLSLRSTIRTSISLR